jgi:hypothetical protein
MQRDHFSNVRWGWANSKSLYGIAKELRDAAQREFSR